MSALLTPSAALLRSNLIAKPARDPALIAAFEAGAVPTRGPSRGLTQFRLPGLGSLSEARRRRRSADHATETRRRRTFAGSGAIPHSIRWEFTEGERAALTVVALEVKARGRCELTVKEIADRAGVAIRTVQYALAKARQLDHLVVSYRKRSPSRNAPNLITITSPEWVSWLQRGPRREAIEREISGCRDVHTSQKTTTKRPQNKVQEVHTMGVLRDLTGAMGLGWGVRGDDTGRSRR